MLCVLVVFNYVAWDQAPHWGKKEKKICVAKKKKNAVSETSQGVVWGGKRVAEAPLHFPPSQASAKAPFFTFFLPCGAWSKAMKDVGDTVALYTMSHLKSHGIKTPRYRANDSVKS